jgi:hypothetical protein
MEPAKISIDKIVAGLEIDEHICNKELFAFVNRSLMVHGKTAAVVGFNDITVWFRVEEIKDGNN